MTTAMADPKAESSDLRINGADLIGAILRARIQERRHLTDMSLKKTKKIGIK
jgi:hypothetical protein